MAFSCRIVNRSDVQALTPESASLCYGCLRRKDLTKTVCLSVTFCPSRVQANYLAPCLIPRYEILQGGRILIFLVLYSDFVLSSILNIKSVILFDENRKLISTFITKLPKYCTVTMFYIISRQSE